MKIAEIGNIYETIPPVKYGGIERIIYFLCNELSNRGHEVTLFASGDSHINGNVVHFLDKPNYTYNAELSNRHIIKTVEYIKDHDFDIVHSHVDSFLNFAKELEIPVVHTLHMDVNMPRKKAIYERNLDANYIALSGCQRRNAEKLGMNVVETIYNGIDVENYICNTKPDDYVCFLSNFAEFKGPELAIEAARKANVKLIMAGKVANNQEYFDRKVRPHIDNKNVIFVGELDDQGKKELLKNSIGMLFPSTWDEPCALTLMESLACGTPVIGFPVGCVPEIVTHEKYGYIVPDVDSMSQAIQKLNQIDRLECHNYASGYFNIKRMTDEYENTFRRMIGSGRDGV